MITVGLICYLSLYVDAKRPSMHNLRSSASGYKSVVLLLRLDYEIDKLVYKIGLT